MLTKLSNFNQKMHKKVATFLKDRPLFPNVYVEVIFLSIFIVPFFLVHGTLLLSLGIYLITLSTPVFSTVLPVLILVLATAVPTLRNPMQALLALIGVFLGTVVFYLILGIRYVSYVFLIVYVGAVAILFLFVVMLLDIKSLTPKTSIVRHTTQTTALVSAAALLIVSVVQMSADFTKQFIGRASASSSRSIYSTEQLEFSITYGADDILAFTWLYNDHVALFLIITLDLLIAMIAAIVIASSVAEEATSYTP